ncbi:MULTISPECIES: type II toxin-antitoxin system RelE/ParE family toxin [unclassified Pseudomonas]|uniref:type II toxin-antitoxin system RelE/ParE family toxin n=1 Tax=unclassified Pseudomonas TaxID=196821 RepID=UPI002447768D|nr:MULTISPECIES: type II toxin-antitoxin system RelE/ParE family toxin [unclassified Pseudomonas]MDG9928332.1 type II toxin-antitoxin system RelE/ParE family toxin [Pseudomonas sp. GD04042]MDH0481104.1 type II toxin-antitoxin system RelE/ParE family toxin [Pseudomonas sp. GD04015]MDH0604440.1 type II toxin-antitoxin system RelE/ParE family toxin [Pseudomonas sp. GD03869]MDH0896093.1 type II toxin-antitoxin system RelE/ParE family toxin [Pseudomonas sp. GD03875]MDH1064812.1 type II toxin-antito
MIVSFRHKGLHLFHETGNTRGIQAAHGARLKRQLQILDRATVPGDLNVPGWRLHPLRGDLAGFWSITVSGNWRLIFRFIGSDVELVDYLDYH